MRIVLVTHHFLPEFEGGTEAVVRAQARELAARGHHVRIVVGTDEPHRGADVERLEVQGLEVNVLRRHRDEPYDLELARPRLRALVAGLVAGADLVHVHQWKTLHQHLVRDSRAVAPVVVTLHDLFVTCPREFRLPPDPALVCPPRGEFEACVRCVANEADWSHAQFLAGFEHRAAWTAAELAAADAVVCPSRAQVARIAEFHTLDEARLHVVPHGLSEALPRLVTRGWLGLGPLRVLFLGHRSEVKGLRELVRGAAALGAAERARLELVLLGEAVQPGFDDELRALGRGLTLRFLGSYSHADLAARFAALGPVHLGAFPSRAWESYGLVPDELMALGLPVWVSDRGAPRERIAGAGRVLPAEDAAAWTRELARALAEPESLERERLALPTKVRTASEAVRELEALYAHLVARRAATGLRLPG
jgi:glycosyltransferase involved in cell wall biosynthesis